MTSQGHGFAAVVNNKKAESYYLLLITRIIGIQDCFHVTTSYTNYFINFAKGLFPLASEAHCGYTSLHGNFVMISKKVSLYYIFYLLSDTIKLTLHTS